MVTVLLLLFSSFVFLRSWMEKPMNKNTNCSVAPSGILVCSVMFVGFSSFAIIISLLLPELGSISCFVAAILLLLEPEWRLLLSL